MADAKLTELPEATIVADTDELYLVQGGFSRRVSWATLKSYVNTLNFRVVTGLASDAVLATDGIVYVEPPAGGTTMTFPLAATITGKVFVFRNRNSVTEAVTIAAQGGELIDGVATFVLQPDEAVRIHCDGVGFWVI